MTFLEVLAELLQTIPSAASATRARDSPDDLTENSESGADSLLVPDRLLVCGFKQQNVSVTLYASFVLVPCAIE